MPKGTQESLNEEEKNQLLDILENQGREKWLERWNVHMAFPPNLDPLTERREEQEKILRYLLLRVLINQQAQLEKVREFSIRISEEFTNTLLFQPHQISEADYWMRCFMNKKDHILSRQVK